MNQCACGAASPGTFTTMRSGLECSNFSSQEIGNGLGLGNSARAAAEIEMIANAAAKMLKADVAKANGFIGVILRCVYGLWNVKYCWNPSQACQIFPHTTTLYRNAAP